MSASRRERSGRAAVVGAALAALASAIGAIAHAAAPTPPPPFSEVLDRVAARRAALAARYDAARTGRARAAIRDEARAFVVGTLVADIFPAWMGMPSGGGPQATASLPHQPGMYISCSYFLTAALQNAGLVLESRARFAQAPALWIQRALLPPGGRVHRYGGLPADALERRLADDLGDGLYVVGLDIHVGFLVVRDGRASIVHSSYTPPGTVVEEPIVASEAIANSRAKGYWISPLFRDDRLVELWLHRRPVPAPRAWDGHWTQGHRNFSSRATRTPILMRWRALTRTST
jgi:hypothetical protein